MDLKKVVNSFFTYTPTNEYEFNILENVNINENEPNTTNQTIYNSLNSNLNFVKTTYNTLINSDVVIREFTLNARNKQFNAFLLYIDGLVDTNLMNDFVLKPLMLRNNSNLYDKNQTKVISESISNNVIVRKVKKFDIVEYLKNCLMPQNSVKALDNFSEILSGVNSGNCALFVDTLNVAFDIEVKGFKQRSIDSPSNEVVIKGSQEAFVENIRTNTSIIRRLINNENLIIENVEVGKITKTKCGICYMQNITNADLVAEVKYRINNLAIDSLVSSGELEQLISDENELGIPETMSTERPDKACEFLLQGRVVIIVNGSPYAIILPVSFIDFMTTPEDHNLKTNFANFLRVIRFIGSSFTLLLPGLYIAVTGFHQEILPTELLFSILASRENVPFPVIFEILIMEFSFELIREAGLRVPSPVGPTIGIVGALVLGQAAVSADIVSPILIIIVAITGISSFAIPDFIFGFHLRYFRFLFILLGYMAGFLGIGIGLFVYVSILCSLNSFGIPFTAPFAPIVNTKGVGYLVSPIWKRENRAKYVAPKKVSSQEKISMKWKFNNGGDK